MKNINWQVAAILCCLTAVSAQARAGEDQVSRLKAFFTESLTYDDFSAMYRCGQGQQNPKIEFAVSGVSKDAITIRCTATGASDMENSSVLTAGYVMPPQTAARKISTSKLSAHQFDVRSTAGARVFHIFPIAVKTGVFDLDERGAVFPGEVPLGMVSDEAVNAALTQALQEHQGQWVDAALKRLLKESQARQAQLEKSPSKLKKLMAELGAIMADPNIKKAGIGPKY